MLPSRFLRPWLRALPARARRRTPLQLECLENRLTPTQVLQAHDVPGLSAAVAPQVNQASLGSVSITPSVAAPTFGQAGLTLTASLTGPAGTPGGSVDFLLDGTPVRTNVPLSNGSATSAALPTTLLTVGTHMLTLNYSGDAAYGSANGLGTTTLTVGKATPVVTVMDVTGVYNGSPFVATALVKNVNGVPGSSLEGVDLAVSYFPGSSASGTPLAGAPTAAGTCTTIATFAGSADYTAASSNPLTFTIGQNFLTITVDNVKTVYGAPLPVLPIHYTGFVPGDTAASLTTAPTVATTATVASGVGNYPITATGAVADNYIISAVAGIMTVAPAPLTVTADDQAMVQGAALPNPTAHYAGFVNGDTAASLITPPLFSTTATSTSSAGTYPIHVFGAVSANYTITYVDSTLTITSPPGGNPNPPGGNPSPGGSQAIQLTAPARVKAHAEAVSFAKQKIGIHGADPQTLLQVHVSTSVGRFTLHVPGVKVKGNNTRTLSLSGNQAALNRGLKALSLQLGRGHAAAKITLTVSDGHQSRHATIRIVF